VHGRHRCCFAILSLAGEQLALIVAREKPVSPLSPQCFSLHFFPGRFKRAKKVARLILCKTQKYTKILGGEWQEKKIKVFIIFFFYL